MLLMILPAMVPVLSIGDMHLVLHNNNIIIVVVCCCFSNDDVLLWHEEENPDFLIFVIRHKVVGL